jgi:hypothetical protein
MYGGFCDNVRTPAAFLDPEMVTMPNAPPLPNISTWTPNIRECEPGSALMLALEARVLNGRAIGGRRDRPCGSLCPPYLPSR